MPDNLFTDQDDQIQIDDNKNYLEELVGEGKKYKTPEVLAKSAVYKDAHISKLERENAQKDADYAKLREEYNAAASLRELLKEFKPQQTLDNHEQPEVNNEVKTPAIKPEDIEEMISKRIKQNDTEKVYQQNFNSVQAKLKERYGEGYNNVLKEQTQNLGLSAEMVNELARTAPKAFFKTMGLDEQKEDLFQAPPRSDQGFTPNAKNKRTWAYYQNLKKTDPKTYNKPETKVQMHKDRAELGEAFKDGDWNAFG